MDFIRAHRKAIIAAVAGVLVIFLDADTAKEVAGGLGAALTWAVPNDAAAVERVYHRRT